MRIQFLIFLLVVCTGSFAQNKKEKKENDTCLKPLTSDAFNRMIIQDITYAIVGEATPVSGIKIDVTKPEGTIAGLFPVKKNPSLLFGFDLKGGVTDKNFSILKGYNNFNTAFEAKPILHIIVARGSAKFGPDSVACPNALIVSAKNELVNLQNKNLDDTTYVVTRIYNRHLSNIKKPDTLPSAVTTVTNVHKAIAVHFLRKFLKNDTINGKTDMASILAMSFDSILIAMPVAKKSGDSINVATYIDDARETFKKYQKLHANSRSDKLDKFISNASEVWTQKHYEWISITPIMRTEKVNEYYTKYQDRDSSYFKAGYQFYYGITAYYNVYLLGIQNKTAHLFRGGITLSRSNNLTSLTSFNYETRSPFFANGGSVTQKTKSGTAYNHNEIKTGFLSQLNLEYYFLPLSSLVPGLYISSSLNYSTLYSLPTIVGRENDKYQIPIEGGLVFNITNREKEKSLLSILLYVRHEDLTDKRRIAVQTGLEESRDDFRKRNVGFGLRVGIPINLPQSAK